MGQGRIAVIEAIRGLAAISVALFHFSVQLEGPVRAIFGYGWLGVDVFFVISGFVIPFSLFGRGYSVRQFPQVPAAPDSSAGAALPGQHRAGSGGVVLAARYARLGW